MKFLSEREEGIPLGAYAILIWTRFGRFIKRGRDDFHELLVSLFSFEIYVLINKFDGLRYKNNNTDC